MKYIMIITFLLLTGCYQNTNQKAIVLDNEEKDREEGCKLGLLHYRQDVYFEPVHLEFDKRSQTFKDSYGKCRWNEKRSRRKRR